MSSAVQQMEALATLFSYPGTGYAGEAEDTAALAGSSVPALLEFAHQIHKMPLGELQEIYTSTFDLNPVCPLDIGWHLFGEEYDRGLLLAYMRRQLRSHGITEAGELPDHISHALLLVARMKPRKAEEFASVIVAPALKRMLKCVPADNVFAGLLRAAQQLITVAYPAACEPAAAVAEGVAS